MYTYHVFRTIMVAYEGQGEGQQRQVGDRNGCSQRAFLLDGNSKTSLDLNEISVTVRLEVMWGHINQCSDRTLT